MERRDGLREVSKEDVGSIRARERSFTVFPQISDDGEDGRRKKGRFPAKQSHSSQIALARATEFWWAESRSSPWLLCFREATRRMHLRQCLSLVGSISPRIDVSSMGMHHYRVERLSAYARTIWEERDRDA